MSIIHEALKKASRRRDGLYHLIKYEPIEERLHIERPDKAKRYAVIIIVGLVTINVSIFAWNISLKNEMRRIALSTLPPQEQLKKEELPSQARIPVARPEIPLESEEELNRVEETAKEEPDLIKKESLPQLVLKGTTHGRERSWAFINEKMVKEGDEIDGAEILSIHDNSVILRMGDEEFEITK